MNNPEIEAAIRRRAQQLYEQRGRVAGHEVEDWLQAESEVLTPRPAYVVVRLDGVTYTAKYDREHCDGYCPGEFRPHAPVEVRINANKLFVKRPNGKELETHIVRATS